MSYSGYVSLLICSFAVMVLALVLPFVTADLRAAQKRSNPYWALPMGFALMLVAIGKLRHATVGPEEIIAAVLLSAMLVAGAFTKWVMDAIARRSLWLQEDRLFVALLVAPLAAIPLALLFGASVTARALLFWFANGFFWQAVCNDCLQMFAQTPPVSRRPDPPDLGVGGCHRELWRQFPRSREV